jgi:cytochrome c556
MTTSVRRIGFVVSAATVLGLALAGFGRAEDKPKPKEEPKKLTVMQRKLANSQQVLEGLATKDFKKIDAGADGLLECLKDVTWKINETEKYLAHTNDFRARVEGLKKAAKDKNIDAAALSYVDMTLTCVRCHQHLRGE